MFNACTVAYTLPVKLELYFGIITGKNQYFILIKMTKVKKEVVAAEEETVAPEKSYQELIANVNPIATPLASKKLSKKLYKCVKKGN